MKKQMVALTIITMMVSPVAFAQMRSHSGMMMEEGKSGGEGMGQGEHGMAKVYQCPMDRYTSDKPGQCPKCGMNLEEKQMMDAAAKAALEKSQTGE